MNAEQDFCAKIVEFKESNTSEDNNSNLFLQCKAYLHYDHYKWCPVKQFQNQCNSINSNSVQEIQSANAFNHLMSTTISGLYQLPFPPIFNKQMPESTHSLNFMPFMPSLSCMSSKPFTHSIVYSRCADNSMNEEDIQSNISDQKLYSCRLCNGFYQSLNDKEFRAHLNAHVGESQPFLCQICGKPFKFRSLWRNHIMAHMLVKVRGYERSPRVYDSNRFNLKCKTCNNKFNCDQCEYHCGEKSKLERHQRMHAGVKPFQCPSCDYKSYDKTKIRRHYVTHTREKPFICEKCKSKFSQSGSLKGHLARVHGISDVKFVCAYCKSFQTSNLGQLRTHSKQIHGNVSFTYAVAN